MNATASISGDSAPASASPLRLLLVDDHAIFRRGLVSLIATDPAFTVCGEAANAAEALTAMRELRPDMAIVDIALGGTNGIELVKQMKAERPELRVLVLSMHDEAVYALRALRAGAGAYIMKQEAVANALAALRAVSSGETYLSARFRDQLAFKALRAVENGAASPVDKLSDRELEVLEHLGMGRGTRDIAQALHLSPKTVETHRAHIKDKLKFRDSHDMVRFAITWAAQQQG